MYAPTELRAQNQRTIALMCSSSYCGCCCVAVAVSGARRFPSFSLLLLNASCAWRSILHNIFQLFTRVGISAHAKWFTKSILSCFQWIRCFCSALSVCVCTSCILIECKCFAARGNSTQTTTVTDRRRIRPNVSCTDVRWWKSNFKWLVIYFPFVWVIAAESGCYCCGPTKRFGFWVRKSTEVLRPPRTCVRTCVSVCCE